MAQHGVEVRAHLLHAQLQQLGQLPGHADGLSSKALGSTRLPRMITGTWTVLAVLVAEEALAQLGQPVLSALQGASFSALA